MYPVPDSGISSISFDEDKPKKHRPPKNLAHAGGGAIKKHKAELKSLECSIKVTVATIIFVASLTITAIALMIAFRPTETYRQKICRQIQEAEVKPSIWDINFCLEGDCEFDVGACTNSCPFGYESDEKTNCAVSCQCAVKGTFEADIRFDSENLPRLIKYYFDPNGGNNFALQSSSTVNWRWPKNENGKVIVAVYPHPESGMHRVGNVIRAGDWFAKHTCIQLQVSPTQVFPSIQVYIGGECSSDSVGRVGDYQQVSLGLGCQADDVVIHEFMHALGFFHEQSRPDRDAFVDIFPEYMRPGRLSQFQKASLSSLKDLNSPYDLASVMHYDSTAYTNGKGPTMLTKDGKRIERNIVPSEIDIAELNAYYECGGNIGWVKGSWGPWTEYTICYGYCGKGVKTRYRNCTDTAGNYAYGCGDFGADKL